MMDAQICYPSELSGQYQVLASNLKALKERESQRSDAVNYDEELRQLDIRIEYPINFERFQGYNTIILRHAFAMHNYYKRSFNDVDRRVFSPDLMDPPLHYFGKRQCDYLKEYIHKIDFSVIFISPLQRTVETAQRVFNDHPKKDNIKFILLPLAAEKMSSQYSFFKWGRLAQLRSLQDKDPTTIKFDMSAFDEYKHKELWQLQMANAGEQRYNLDELEESLQHRFIIDNFASKGKSVSIETEELCYHRSIQLKALLSEAVRHAGPNKKVGLISHGVMIKTLYSKGLSADKKIVKDPNFYLENGNITGINL